MCMNVGALLPYCHQQLVQGMSSPRSSRAHPSGAVQMQPEPSVRQIILPLLCFCLRFQKLPSVPCTLSLLAVGAFSRHERLATAAMAVCPIRQEKFQIGTEIYHVSTQQPLPEPFRNKPWSSSNSSWRSSCNMVKHMILQQTP